MKLQMKVKRSQGEKAKAEENDSYTSVRLLSISICVKTCSNFLLSVMFNISSIIMY